MSFAFQNISDAGWANVFTCRSRQGSEQSRQNDCSIFRILDCVLGNQAHISFRHHAPQLRVVSEHHVLNSKPAKEAKDPSHAEHWYQNEDDGSKHVPLKERLKSQNLARNDIPIDYRKPDGRDYQERKKRRCDKEQPSMRASLFVPEFVCLFYNKCRTRFAFVFFNFTSCAFNDVRAFCLKLISYLSEVLRSAIFQHRELVLDGTCKSIHVLVTERLGLLIEYANSLFNFHIFVLDECRKILLSECEFIIQGGRAFKSVKAFGDGSQLQSQCAALALSVMVLWVRAYLTITLIVNVTRFFYSSDDTICNTSIMFYYFSEILICICLHWLAQIKFFEIKNWYSCSALSGIVDKIYFIIAQFYFVAARFLQDVIRNNSGQLHVLVVTGNPKSFDFVVIKFNCKLFKKTNIVILKKIYDIFLGFYFTTPLCSRNIFNCEIGCDPCHLRLTPGRYREKFNSLTLELHNLAKIANKRKKTEFSRKRCAQARNRRVAA